MPNWIDIFKELGLAGAIGVLGGLVIASQLPQLESSGFALLMIILVLVCFAIGRVFCIVFKCHNDDNNGNTGSPTPGGGA